MDLSQIDSRSWIGRLARLPLRVIPGDAVMTILSGGLRGSKWIAGASTHGCWLGTYEYEKQRLFQEIVRPRSIVFDIGANVGFYSMLSSRLIGTQGKVFAFEPLPRNLSLLRKHLDLNQIRNVTVLEGAISDENGSALLDEGPRGEMAQLNEDGRLRVKTSRLDTLFEQGQIPLPDCIKMDIEGAEYRALCGAKSMLSTAHPTIFLATHGEGVHQCCCDFLKSLGYELRSVDNNKIENTREILATY